MTSSEGLVGTHPIIDFIDCRRVMFRHANRSSPRTAMLRLMDLKTDTLERASYLATIAAAIVAVLALVFGYFQFEDTQKAERETLRLQREAVHDEREAKAIASLRSSMNWKLRGQGNLAERGRRITRR
jgi:hypothetical protein